MTLLPWKQSIDGSFVTAFIKRCLTLNEIVELRKPLPQSRSDSCDKFEFSFETRKALVDIVLAAEHAGGAILESHDGYQSIIHAFEFNSFYKLINNENENYDPLLQVSYVISSSMKNAQLFLRDEEVEIITCSENVTMELARLFHGLFTKSGLVDFASGLTVMEGYIEPIYPELPSFEEQHRIVIEEGDCTDMNNLPSFEEQHDIVKEEWDYTDINSSHNAKNEIDTLKNSLKKAFYLNHFRVVCCIISLVAISLLLQKTSLTFPFQDIQRHTQNVQYIILSLPRTTIQYLDENWDNELRFDHLTKLTYKLVDIKNINIGQYIFESYSYLKATVDNYSLLLTSQSE